MSVKRLTGTIAKPRTTVSRGKFKSGANHSFKKSSFFQSSTKDKR